MKIKLYLDEDVAAPLAEALRQRGMDILTTQEARRSESKDEEQVAFAVEQHRSILTHNKRDFVIIHKAHLDAGKAHWGIIVADQKPVGQLMRMISRLWFTLPAEKMKNHLEFLSNWR